MSSLWDSVVNLEELTQLNLKIAVDALGEVVEQLQKCREHLEYCLAIRGGNCADKVICLHCRKPMEECQCEHTSAGKEGHNG